MNDKPPVHTGWLLATHLQEPNVARLYNQTSTINDGGANAVRRLSLSKPTPSPLPSTGSGGG